MRCRLDTLCTAGALAIIAGGCDALLPYQRTGPVDASPPAVADGDGDGSAARDHNVADGREDPDARAADATRDSAPTDGARGERGAGDLAATDGPAADAAPRDGLAPAGDLGDGGPIAGAWVAVAAGLFTIGSPATEPCRIYNEDQHDVQLSHGYLIQATEVTQAAFAALRGYNPAYHSAGGGGPSCGADCPVENVSWHEAAAYCNTLSIAVGLAPCYACSGSGASVSCQDATAYAAAQIYTCPGYRLPTEAEWEHAYRAGAQTALANGAIDAAKCDKCTSNDANADLVAWYCVNAGSSPQPVAGKQPNAWGLFDMAGNVWEWCHDGYQDRLGTTLATDPWGAAAALTRVARGGSYINPVQRIRAASRLEHSATDRQRWRGFRCARTQ